MGRSTPRSRSHENEVEAILGQGISGAPVMQVKMSEGRFALKFVNGEKDSIEAKIHEKCRKAQLDKNGPIFYSPKTIEVSEKLRTRSLEMFINYEAANLRIQPELLRTQLEAKIVDRGLILQSIHYNALKNAKIAFLFPIVQEGSCEQTLALIAASHDTKSNRASILDKELLISTVYRVATALDWLKCEGYIHDDLSLANMFGVGDKTQLADFSNAKAISGNNEKRQREQFVRLIRALAVSEGYFNILIAIFLLQGKESPVANMYRKDIDIPKQLNMFSVLVRPQFPMPAPDGKNVDSWLVALEAKFQTEFIKELGDKWIVSGESYEAFAQQLIPRFRKALVD